MSDEINKNVINLFAAKSKEELSKEEQKKIKYYAGFDYVKVKRDSNGNKFRKDYLLKYASQCRYMVTVMRETDGEIDLYSYDVPNADLFKFMKSFEENPLDGTIIEINKYIPDEII